MKTIIWTYPISASFNFEGGIESYLTNLFQTGVYIIWNNDPSLQGNSTPSIMAKLKKKLISSEKKGEISNLKFGRSIKVTKIDGFYTEIKD